MPAVFVPNATYFREVNSARGMVGMEIRKRADKLAVLAKGSVGKHTGRLAASIHVEMRPGTGALGPSAMIGSSHRIALLHHTGSRPHIIRAKNPNSYMRFSQHGKIRYAKIVLHPGNKPNPYLTKHLRTVVK